MLFSRSFLNDLGEAKNEYEAIAICYCELLNYVNDTDTQFLAKVGHLSEDLEYGPYAGTFEDLRQAVLRYADQINLSVDRDGTGFDVFRTELIRELCQFQCPKQLEVNVCIPICIFYILEALDSHVGKNLELVYNHYRSYGPLNEKLQEKCLVYLQERESFLSSAYDVGGNVGFRKPLRPTRIGSIFHAVLLVARTKNISVPKIVPIMLNKKCKSSIKERKRFRIASIPYIGFDTFLFHEANSKNPCELGELPKGSFYVEYIEDSEDDNIERITALLELAIRSGANIIIFPEFIMSHKMMDAIQNYLRKLEYSYKEQLCLILAGTCYHWDGQKAGNNILHILNANGTEIGCYYKYSPFLIQAEERAHGATLSPDKHEGNPLKRQYLKTCEILSDPGKECVLLDIEVIGRVLPAICRDVIDGDFTSSLADLFMPSILMVPAWSRSVTGFDTHFSSLANTIHTASLLCNCCNAVEKERQIIGKLFIPAKKATHMEASPLCILRDQECLSLCKEYGGCMVQVEVDFSQREPQAKLQTFFSRNNETQVV